MVDVGSDSGDAQVSPFAERVEQEIKQFLLQKAPHKRDAINALQRTDTIWGEVDSLLILSVVGHLEKAFGVKFEPKDFTPENLANIDKIAAFIEPRFRAS